MDRKSFSYKLPPELIAQAPLARRSMSRLLVLDGATGRYDDRTFIDLPQLVEPGDLLVFNDTRVLPARLFARKASGGSAELLLDRITAGHCGLFQIKSSRSPKPGSELIFADDTRARVFGRDDSLFELEFDVDLIPFLESSGEVPLPPYIARKPNADDDLRYQTVFARKSGAVAAPTAGLHFDEELLDALKRRGIDWGFLTLHVGAGTFAPVRTERIEDHQLHAEWLEVPAALCNRIEATRARGGRVIAVGTTTVRALETAASNGRLEPYDGDTRLFVFPGFEFRVVDAIVTNFHLPESSLLILVAAFAGKDATLRAYEHAVAERYRFFSYGDAMFVRAAVPRDRSNAV